MCNIFLIQTNKIIVVNNMNYKGRLRNYFLENEFKVTYFQNKVNIVNYESIGHFDSNKIIIRKNNESIIINGNNLVVSKLLNDEILIEGKISNIEFR